MINPACRSMAPHRSVRYTRIDGGHVDATAEARGIIVEIRVMKIHFTVVVSPQMSVVSRST